MFEGMLKRQGQIRLSVVANFANRLFTAFSTFLFVPLYIEFLGSDGYSVIAVSITVVSIVLMLEVGLTSAIGREMARKDITDKDRRRTFKAIEHLFMLIMVFVVMLGWIFAPTVAQNLIGKTPVDRTVLAVCLSLIAAEAGLQLFLRFHISVLFGLERQVRAALFTILWIALRNGAVILIIWKNPNLYAFFGWQLAATLLMVVVLKVHSMSFINAWPKTQARFIDREVFWKLRGFASGMLLISIVAVANTQVDRIIIGSIGSLKDLGAYVLAASLGTALLITSWPIMTAVQPRLTVYFTSGKIDDATALFQKATSFLSLLVFPPVLIISIYPDAILKAWVGNVEIAETASSYLPILVLANAAIALATIVYATALANGWTIYHNIVGVASLFVSMPGYYFAFQQFGPIGVAAVFLIIQFVSNLLLSWLVMRKFLNIGFGMHFLACYIYPAIGAIVGAWLFSTIFPTQPNSRPMLLLWLAIGVVMSGVCASAIVLGRMRFGNRTIERRQL